MIVPSGTVKPTRAEKNAATTSALLDAAARTFSEHGYEAATMDEIAERVGLSKGALYYRYKSKEDLFLALLDQRCSAYLARLEQPFDGSSSPAANWTGLSEYFLEVVREGTWPKLFFEFVTYSAHSPRARRELVKRIRALRTAMERIIETQTRDAGAELPVTAADIALAITALGNGLALERLADPKGVPDRAFSELPDLIVAGVVARARGAGTKTPRKRSAP